MEMTNNSLAAVFQHATQNNREFLAPTTANYERLLKPFLAAILR